MLDVVILENTLSISTDLSTNSWDYIALLVGYKSTTEHVRDSDSIAVIKHDQHAHKSNIKLADKYFQCLKMNSV